VAVVVDLFCDDGLGELPDHGQLIAEATVRCTEVIRKRHHGRAVSVGGDVAVVDVRHPGSEHTSLAARGTAGAMKGFFCRRKGTG
jgi:hypothetical protein